jgi:MFS family permease
MSAFKSGSITCASAVGGMFMRSLASRVLHRFGFRQTLMVNAALSGIAIAACGMFYPGTPTWLIWAVVLLGGFFPALQFTSLNSLTYAEIESRDVGRATSLGSFIQQVSLGLGVTVGGIALQISHDLQGHPQMVWSDFWPAFVVVGMFSFLSIPITARLSMPGTRYRGEREGRRRVQIEKAGIESGRSFLTGKNNRFRTGLY